MGSGPVSGYVSGGASSWSEVMTFRGALETSRGPFDGEQELADNLRSLDAVVIKAHYSTTLAGARVSDRLVDANSGEEFNIKQVDDPDGRRELIYIVAEKGRPNG